MASKLEDAKKLEALLLKLESSASVVHIEGEMAVKSRPNFGNKKKSGTEILNVVRNVPVLSTSQDVSKWIQKHGDHALVYMVFSIKDGRYNSIIAKWAWDTRRQWHCAKYNVHDTLVLEKHADSN